MSLSTSMSMSRVMLTSSYVFEYKYVCLLSMSRVKLTSRYVYGYKYVYEMTIKYIPVYDLSNVYESESRCLIHQRMTARVKFTSGKKCFFILIVRQCFGKGRQQKKCQTVVRG